MAHCDFGARLAGGRNFGGGILGSPPIEQGSPAHLRLGLTPEPEPETTMNSPLYTACPACSQPWPPAPTEHTTPYCCSYCEQPWPAAEPEAKPWITDRMLRVARLLHLGALPLWDGWAHSRGRMDPVPEGAMIYSRAMEVCSGWPDNIPDPVLAVFAARPRIRKVLGVYDGMETREHACAMRGGETSLDAALALLASGELV